MNQGNLLTIEVFGEAMRKIDDRFSYVDGRFDEMKSFIMEGFTALDRKIDYLDEHLSSRIDEIMISKADREEVFALQKRVAKIEKKIA